MKEVEKVSVSSIAFTFEKDAAVVLSNYLERLKIYYRNTCGSDEIMSDIEERIAELLVDANCREGIVSKEIIDNIIAVLGTPEDLGDACDNDKSYAKGSRGEEASKSDCREQKKIKKSLFRDVQNNVLGGVCAGLSRYLNINVIIVRLVFLFLLFFGQTFSIEPVLGHSVFTVVLVAYIVFWIAIPPARTVAQRCAMDGVDPGLDGIKQNFDYFAEKTRRGANEADYARHSVASGIGRVILFSIGFLLILLGVFGFVVGLALLFGVEVFMGISAYSLPDYLMLNTANLWWLKMALIGAWFLPCLIFLYLGCKLCLNIKSPSWHPGVVMLVLWFACILTSVIMGVSVARPYMNKYKANGDPVVIDSKYDTLYVKFQKPNMSENAKMHLDNSARGTNLFFVDADGSDSEIAYYPFLRINVDEEDSLNVNIVPSVQYFSGATLMDLNSRNSYVDGRRFSVRDSLITIYPTICSKENKFDGNLCTLRLNVPCGKVVLLKEPSNYVYWTTMY